MLLSSVSSAPTPKAEVSCCAARGDEVPFPDVKSTGRVVLELERRYRNGTP
jgi:hypothetical protein